MSEVNTSSSEWSRDNISPPSFVNSDIVPPPGKRKPPWFRWTFSLPFTVFVALIILFIFMSTHTTGEQKTIYIIGAAVAMAMELLIVGLQWWDRYPYRVQHYMKSEEEQTSQNTDDSDSKS